ncbi:MAG: trigger factor [Gammaproteobacteria bacterium]
MQVSVEAPSKLERRVTIVVPVEELNQAFDKRIASLAKNAKVAGFRPGKAPLNVIKQRYGDTAREEALSEVIQSSLYAAISQEKLNLVGTPTVEPKMITPDQPLEFVATFEVLPEIEDFRFDLSKLEKQVAKITEADIEKVLEHLRSQHTRWKKVDRAAQDKDQVVIDFRGTMDGVAFAGGEAHEYPIVLGSKNMIPGFEEGIVGMKAGEEKLVPVTFPENYFSKEVAGKVAEFTIKAVSVSEPELPEMDEGFVKKLGIKSGKIEELHAEIKKNLERELDRVITAKLKNQVFDTLLSQNALEIPKALIEREASRIHDEVHPNHGEHHSHSESEMSAFNEAAKRNVTLGLLVAEVVKKNKLTADKERVMAHLSKMASAYENPTEVMNWYASNKRAYAEIEMQTLEDQVIEKLLEQVQVTDKMVSYNEIISN